MADNRQKNPSDVLQSYRRWKEEGEALKSQAQGFLVERFHELIQEAQQVQQDLFEDFGHTVKFPANPKFVKKAKGRVAVKKPASASARPASATLPPAPAPAPKNSAAQKASSGSAPLLMSPAAAPARPPATRAALPRTRLSPVLPATAPKRKSPFPTVAQLARQVEKAKQRVAEALASGSPVKIQNAEDRLYELTDELRLLTRDA